MADTAALVETKRTASGSPALPPPSKRQAVVRRSRKVCEHCHARKIKCNILEVGIPCSNCACYKTSCTLRKRKNQRKDSTPPAEGQDDAGMGGGLRLRDRRGSVLSLGTETASPDDGIGLVKRPELNNEAFKVQTPIVNDYVSPIGHTEPRQSWSSVPQWDDNATASNVVELPDLSVDTTYDFSHLTDLDDIFAFTNDFTYDAVARQLGPPFYAPEHASGQANGSQTHTSLMVSATLGLSPADEQYLRSQGCFDLPPDSTLRILMSQYFRLVHPSLPIIFEDAFWRCFDSDHGHVNQISLLVLRSMLFTVSCYLDAETLSSLDFSDPREARNTHYRQAKLLFDFEIEKDPVANAQACLLLTYNSPSPNLLRINLSWLNNALRFARIARADSYHRFKDEYPLQAKLLKRIWWSIIFRDRILCLGMRRSLQVHLDERSHAIWFNDENALQIEDFESELGRSVVHSIESQVRNIGLQTALCKLIIRLATPLRLLYQDELLDDRLETACVSLPETISTIQCSLESLGQWYDDTSEKYPFPVSLDDVHESLCLYANMLFILCASVTFALNLHLMMIHENLPASRKMFDVGAARQGLQTANDDLTRRLQELVQVKVMKDLPITATPLIGPPLVLQALNLAASRGSRSEATEARRLDIFTRTLRSQQRKFDGSDFYVDVLSNIIAYAQDDDSLTSGMNLWRENSNSNQPRSRVGSNGASGSIKRLGWVKMMEKRPKQFLRLMFHIEYALCNWGVPQEKHFPPALRRDEVS